MKAIVILILLSMCTCQVFCQNISDTTKQHKNGLKVLELGVNMTPFLDAFFKRDSANLGLFGAYPLRLSLTANLPRWSIYSGIGGEYRNEKVTEDGFADVISKTTKGVFAQIGIGYRFFSRNRVRALIGFDCSYQTKVSKAVNDSGIDRITVVEQTRWIGAGPKMVLQYWPTKQFGIGTHIAGYFRLGNSDKARLFANFPELNDLNQQTEITELHLIAPANLIFFFNLFQQP
jgi:hypothetical protein